MLQTIVGGELKASSGVHLQHDSSWIVSNAEQPVTASWKGRWLIVAFPHGRALLLEHLFGRLSLAVSFECPLNTSAVAFSPDAVDDSALVVFGTNEGPLASQIHIVRLTFSTETIAVKVVDSFLAPGGISMFASLDEHRMLVSYTVRNVVDIFKPSPQNLGNGGLSPSLRGTKSGNIEERSDSTGRLRQANFSEIIDDSELPLEVFVMHNAIYTVAGNGIISKYLGEDPYNLISRRSLGFEILSIVPLTMPYSGILACGLRGQLAVMDIELKGIVQFHRCSSQMLQIDGFAVSVSHDSRLLVLQTCVEYPGRIDLVDLGVLCLGGTAPVLNTQLRRREGDDSVYELYPESDSSQDGVDQESLKSCLRDAWNLLETRSSLSTGTGIQ